jgi:hypothetical protein
MRINVYAAVLGSLMLGAAAPLSTSGFIAPAVVPVLDQAEVSQDATMIPLPVFEPVAPAPADLGLCSI